MRTATMTPALIRERYTMRSLAETGCGDELRGTLEIIRWSAGKEIAEQFECEDRSGWPQADEWAGVLFTDGTGLLLVTDEGWAGTDVTAGRERSVTYYALTPKEAA